MIFNTFFSSIPRFIYMKEWIFYLSVRTIIFFILQESCSSHITQFCAWQFFIRNYNLLLQGRFVKNSSLEDTVITIRCNSFLGSFLKIAQLCDCSVYVIIIQNLWLLFGNQDLSAWHMIFLEDLRLVYLLYFR